MKSKRTQTNHYEFLKLRKDATAETIDTALRIEERKWFHRHNMARAADKVAEARATLELLAEIRKTLLDPEIRASYDYGVSKSSSPKRLRRHRAALNGDPHSVPEPTDTDTSETVPSPIIVNFAASPVLVRAGDPIELRWETTGVTNVHVEGFGGVADLPPTGSLTVIAAVSCQFELIATGPGGSVRLMSNLIEVEHALEIVTLSVSPTTAIAGDPVELKWETRGAASVRILELPHLGALQPSGSRTIAARDSEQFTLIAYGSTDTATQESEFLRVLPMPPLAPVKVPIPSVNTVMRLTGDLTRLARLAPMVRKAGPIRTPEPPTIRPGRPRHRLALPHPPEIPSIPDFLTSEWSNEA